MPRQISPAALVAARANLAKAREMGQLEDVVEGLIQTLESEEEEVEWQQRLATDSQLRYKHNLKCVLHQWKEVVESRVGNFRRASMQERPSIQDHKWLPMVFFYIFVVM